MYRVKLTEFEGPLDLLLFFIRRDELDITNIPISRITQEFLEYLHLMASLDLEVAGEFIVMAATLMQIKVRMLLPRDENAPEEEDPRAELIRRLIEYKRFKEMAQEFGSLEEEHRKVYYRRFFEGDTKTLVEEEDDGFLKDISLFNLIAAYKSALDQMPRKVVHEVHLLSVTVDEQMSFVMDFLRVHGPTTLLQLVAHMVEKIRIIVTVIAVLELTKNKAIALAVVDGRDDIAIRPLTSLAPMALASR
ncbi:MAG: chromosome segregation and condensation protein ScpA [Bacteroidetes bacterium]|jgi:segregation and condensation protein A|nr:chromosome segregation and condensation protein ScpA [Bacteroidota bacterium]